MCFLIPAIHMETRTRYTQSNKLGLSLAYLAYISISANPAAFRKLALLCGHSRALPRVHKANKNFQLLLASCPVKFSSYGYTHLTAI